MTKNPLKSIEYFVTFLTICETIVVLHGQEEILGTSITSNVGHTCIFRNMFQYLNSPLRVYVCKNVWIFLTYPYILLLTLFIHQQTFIPWILTVAFKMWQHLSDYNVLVIWNGNSKQAAGLCQRFWECNCANIILYERVVD